MARITFKLRPRETGLRAVGAGPRSYDINVDGRKVGSVSPWRNGLKFKWTGWYFYVSDATIGPYINTCDAPVATVETAKAEAKTWILSLLRRSDETEADSEVSDGE